MKRARPHQHYRKIRTRKGRKRILINKGIKRRKRRATTKHGTIKKRKEWAKPPAWTNVNTLQLNDYKRKLRQLLDRRDFDMQVGGPQTVNAPLDRTIEKLQRTIREMITNRHAWKDYQARKFASLSKKDVSLATPLMIQQHSELMTDTEKRKARVPKPKPVEYRIPLSQIDLYKRIGLIEEPGVTYEFPKPKEPREKPSISTFPGVSGTQEEVGIFMDIRKRVEDNAAKLLGQRGGKIAGEFIQEIDEAPLSPSDKFRLKQLVKSPPIPESMVEEGKKWKKFMHLKELKETAPETFDYYPQSDKKMYETMMKQLRSKKVTLSEKKPIKPDQN